VANQWTLWRRRDRGDGEAGQWCLVGRWNEQYVKALKDDSGIEWIEVVPALGLTVVAQTGDGPIRGRIVRVGEDGVQLQCGEAWFETVALECLYAPEVAPPINPPSTSGGDDG
jgi:hypothetical protein